MHAGILGFYNDAIETDAADATPFPASRHSALYASSAALIICFRKQPGGSSGTGTGY